MSDPECDPDYDKDYHRMETLEQQLTAMDAERVSFEQERDELVSKCHRLEAALRYLSQLGGTTSEGNCYAKAAIDRENHT